MRPVQVKYIGTQGEGGHLSFFVALRSAPIGLVRQAFIGLIFQILDRAWTRGHEAIQVRCSGSAYLYLRFLDELRWVVTIPQMGGAQAV